MARITNSSCELLAKNRVSRKRANGSLPRSGAWKVGMLGGRLVADEEGEMEERVLGVGCVGILLGGDDWM